MTLNELCADYAPYDRVPEFAEGFMDYQLGYGPWPNYAGVQAQAYDRRRECAMRWKAISAIDAYCKQQTMED